MMTGNLRHRRRRGFTLVELIVVIGIMVLLASIAIPIVNSTRRKAVRARLQLDLNAIAMALEAYKQDFKDYPRPPRDASNNTTGANSRVLAWALIGPFRQDDTSPTVGSTAAKATDTTGPNAGKEAFDGADGPGFRTFWKAGSGGSKVWGPYLPIEKFNLSDDKLDLEDSYGAPIEYFPRWRAPVKTLRLFGTNNTTASNLGGGIYDWHQGDQSQKDGLVPKAVLYFQKALGDEDLDDAIGATEKLGTCPEFLLLSRGPTGQFDFPDKAYLQSKRIDQLGAVTNLP
jgi:prepilin-type N-terminal cleavage/methylation domain-containing protein